MRYVQLALLALVAAPMAIMVVVWSGGGNQNARANPELRVGIDLNPNTPSTYERCLPISGAGVTFDVDVFVLDVVDLMAFAADVEYDSSVVDVIGTEVDFFLGSSAFDASEGGGGLFNAAAVDESVQGHTGSGILARLSLEAVGNGASPFDLNFAEDHGVLLQDPVPNPIGDTSGDGFFDGPFINAQTMIAVGSSGFDDGDGDNVPDGCDNCPNWPNTSQTDTDSDTDPNNPNMYPSQPITDTGGDACDTDDDNDGIPDFISPGPDNCRTVYNPGQENTVHPATTAGDACEDWDTDTIVDADDNCPDNPNQDQADMDLDGVGDVCDPDKDGDGYANGPDNCPDVYNPDQTDSDGDGTGDACEDSDGDGWYDPVDNCPNHGNPSQADDDTDGVGNPCDNCDTVPNPVDADGDGQDGEDPVDGVDNDGDGLVDEDHETGQENLDNDALGDACDWDDDNDSKCDPGETSPFCTGSDNCRLVANGPSQSGIQCVGNQIDTDGDGPGDPCDPDADADGYSKVYENQWGAKDCQYSSRPEVCDGTDTDKDGSVDEGWGPAPSTPFPDSDGDTIRDCVDDNWDTDDDGTADKFDGDDDDDGSLDIEEHSLVTDSLCDCDNGVGYPDWGFDFNEDKAVNILDIVMLTPPVFNSEGDPNHDTYFTDADPDYSRRKDLNGDKVINILDIVKVTPPVFNTTCTP